MAIIRSSDPTAKQARATEKIAQFKAEQQRLKDAASDRRAAAAAAAEAKRSGQSAAPDAPRAS
jgi:BRCT domain type II-containing protein